MCGGIVGALNFHARRPALVAAATGSAAMVTGDRAAAPLAIHASYSAGRIGSYAVAGAIAALGVLGAIRTPGLAEQVKRGLACLA